MARLMKNIGALAISACIGLGLSGCSEDRQILIYSKDDGIRKINVYSIVNGSTTKATKAVIKSYGKDSVVIYYDVEARKSAKNQPLGYSGNDYVDAYFDGKRIIYARDFRINEYGNKITFDSPLTEKIGEETRNKLQNLYTPNLDSIGVDMLRADKNRGW